MKTSIGDTNRLEAVFASSPENERISRVTAAAFAAVLNPTVEELSDFKTAVSEAVTNAIIHAYPEGRGEIRLTLERKKNEVTVHIRDFGRGDRGHKEIHGAAVYDQGRPGALGDGIYLYGSVYRPCGGGE